MRPRQTADRYDPEKVYLLQKDGDMVFLGALVDHQYADQTAGLEQALFPQLLQEPLEQPLLDLTRHQARPELAQHGVMKARIGQLQSE